MFQKNTGLPALAFPHFHLTQLRGGDPSHTGLSVRVYPHFRLTRLLEGDLNESISVEDVMGVEVDELEEDLE